MTGTRTQPRHKSKLHKEQSLKRTWRGAGGAGAMAGEGRGWGRSAGPVASLEVGREDVAAVAVALPFASPTSGGSGASAGAGRAELGFRGAWREVEPQMRSGLQHSTRQRGLGLLGLLPGPP